MDPRIITNYNPINHGMTLDFLYKTNDWDLIELNYKLDPDELENWYQTVSNDFDFMRFDFFKNQDRLNVEVSKNLVERGYCGIYCGPITGLTLAWPIERYEPLPPPVQAKKEMFPEVDYPNFFKNAKIMSRFKFGYFLKMIEALGEDSFRQALLTTHYPGMYIRQHTDSKVLKLHIPMEKNEKALFHFGKERDRSYHLKLGRVYILNTDAWHGTSNDSDLTRTHMITRIADWQILKVIGLTND